MKAHETWIWLPAESHPDRQTTLLSATGDTAAGHYTVAELKKTYTFPASVTEATLRFSGDTAFVLYGNGERIATGPATPGGDFLGDDRPRENFYAYEVTVHPRAATLELYARVRMMPVQICEYSKGRGGFMLCGTLTLADGTREVISTADGWEIRVDPAYTAPNRYDGGLPVGDYCPAEIKANIWHTETAPIPPRVEEAIIPAGGVLRLAPREEREVTLELDRIYAGFLSVSAEAPEGAEVTAEVRCRELEEGGSAASLRFVGRGEYRGFTLHSAGNLLVTARNLSDAPVALTVGLITTCYPVDTVALVETGDPELDRVLEVCRHTLKYCRQTHHLDSPRHCEPLACTGDYYIESLMTLFSFGDMRLAEFDVRRTAELLLRMDGRMFHTTYSLIWVRMLYDTYMATGNLALLEDCEAALMLLLRRFASYLGDNGLIETPPDYMFVDWIYVDGHSLHHPPKALGQTCLNCYYFGALSAAEGVFGVLGREAMADKCRREREALGLAINTHLYDPVRGLYFEGLDTPQAGGPSYWLSENPCKRYYRKHANILAACFGVCDDGRGRELVRRIMAEEIEGEVQPYFLHFLFEAVYRLGLREDFTRALAEGWKEPVLACPKGLVEGFVTPEPGYGFDHSHAWGGTPLYSVPRALMGLDIVEAGMRTVRLSPSLLGGEATTVQLMTPYGPVTCTQRAGEPPVIEHPREVRVMVE